MRFPSRKNLIETGDAYPVDDYYSKNIVIKYLMRARFAVLERLLTNQTFENLLEIGTGAGILLPQLTTYLKPGGKVIATDIHDRLADIHRLTVRGERLESEVSIVCNDIMHLGVRKGVFDGVVCFSVLPYLDDLHGAIQEIAAITAKNAVFMAGFPVDNTLLRFNAMLHNWNYDDEKHASHHDIAMEIQRYFEVQTIAYMPFRFPCPFNMFMVVSARKL